MTELEDALAPGDALIIVDVQNDFCPGGALPIENGNAVVPILNRWIAAAVSRNVPVYASRDWHPAGHVSFRQSGGPWPPHCLQDSEGARFHPDLKLPDSTVIVTKGVRFDRDQNSAFDQTGLARHLRKAGIKRLWIGGLAEDICVLATVLDARREGFEAILIREATRPVTPRGGEEARRKMQEAGAAVTGLTPAL
ncbi:isochorismatase hydrolase [Methylocaldum marinum]|uniref:nicotinamidase n=1 Tax=Methylocaldum marinum TaxID=1432792 RepID=A0A250KYK0_9GAMM|nr:nicotinamidase [Methylocaldum marinum]BBA36705.1 isochorismatase hydrolase [Methylocaldum marinum]